MCRRVYRYEKTSRLSSQESESYTVHSTYIYKICRVLRNFLIENNVFEGTIFSYTFTAPCLTMAGALVKGSSRWRNISVALQADGDMRRGGDLLSLWQCQERNCANETAEKKSPGLSLGEARTSFPWLESNTSNEMENNNIANDVKTSLASLEVVRVKSINSESLSSDEIQSAQSNLSDIIRTAESIKENLNSNENSITRIAVDNSNDGDDGSSVDDEAIRTGQNALPADTQLTERRSTTAIGTSEGASEAPKRRLSTPCCIPLQSSEIETRVSLATMSLYCALCRYEDLI